MNGCDPSGEKQGSPNQPLAAEEALRRSEERLATSEAFYRSLVENLPQNILCKDLNGRFTYANQNFCRMVGRPPEEVLGKTDFDLYPAELAEKYRADDCAVMRSGKLLDQIEENVLPSGERRHVHVVKVPTYDAEGHPLGTQCIFWDITERKQAVEAVQAISERYRSYIEVTGQLGWTTNAAGEVREDIPSWRKYTGQTYEQVKGWGWTKALHPDDAEHATEVWRKAVETNSAYEVEYRVKRYDGVYRYFMARGVPILEEDGSIREWVGTCIDITERKRAEEALRQSEERYRRLVEAAPGVVYVIAADGTLASLNPAFERITGWSAADWIGKPFLPLVHPDDQALAMGTFQQVLRGETLPVYELRILSKSGNYLVGEFTSTPQIEQGRIVGQLGVSRDITERKRAEAALKTSEQRFRALIENSMDAIALLDSQGSILFFPIPATARILGYDDRELVGRSIFELIHPDDRARISGLSAPLLKAPHSQVTAQFRFQHKDGTWPWVEATGTNLLAEPTVQAVVINYADITERKLAEEQRLKLERQIQQAQKLESLGVLAGGIAHDFNNILMAIMGNVNLALLDLSPASPVREELLEAEKATRRAAELTKQMLAYSGRGRFQVQRLDLREVIEEMTHLLQVSISKKAVLRFNFAANIPAIEADATQLRQVIMNLVINASEAIGERSGVIAISTGAMECDQAYLAETWLHEALAAGLYTYLEVADTGCGIAKDQLPMVFDPFFTTKFTGRGLGLAAVLGIVRGHRGAIKVYSQPGKGTTFKVLFPAASQSAEKLAEAVSAPTRWQGSGLLLLVDDEEGVRTIGKKTLERLGFEVLTAADGRQALEVFRAHADEIAVVLLDLTMPHMDGEEAFRELRRIRAGVRVILSSGYSEQDVVGRFAGKGLAGFIQKPYTVGNLQAVLQPLFPGANGTATGAKGPPA